MADLADVSTGDIITSTRANLVNDYIQDGTHKINTLSIDVGGTEVITSGQALTNVTNTAWDAACDHIGADGTSHSCVGANNTHRGSDGTNHCDVVKANTHIGSVGTDHSCVVANTTHRGSVGTDHGCVGLNNTHRGSDGTNHTYINQDIQTTASVTFANVCGSTLLCGPTVCGTTLVRGVTVCGSTLVRGVTLYGSTLVCGGIVCGTTCVKGGVLCSTGNTCVGGTARVKCLYIYPCASDCYGITHAGFKLQMQSDMFYIYRSSTNTYSMQAFHSGSTTVATFCINPCGGLVRAGGILCGVTCLISGKVCGTSCTRGAVVCSTSCVKATTFIEFCGGAKMFYSSANSEVSFCTG